MIAASLPSHCSSRHVLRPDAPLAHPHRSRPIPGSVSLCRRYHPLSYPHPYVLARYVLRARSRARCIGYVHVRNRVSAAGLMHGMAYISYSSGSRLRCIRPRSFCRLSNIAFLLIQSSVTHAPACSLDHLCSAVLECNPRWKNRNRNGLFSPAIARVPTAVRGRGL